MIRVISSQLQIVKGKVDRSGLAQKSLIAKLPRSLSLFAASRSRKSRSAHCQNGAIWPVQQRPQLAGDIYSDHHIGPNAFHELFLVPKSLFPTHPAVSIDNH